MVLINVKKQDELLFLYNCKVNIPIKELVENFVNLNNTKRRLERLCRGNFTLHITLHYLTLNDIFI